MFIVKVIDALRATISIAGVDVMSNLSCGAASVTIAPGVANAAAMRRHFKFAGGTMSGDKGWSLSSSYQTGLAHIQICCTQK